MNTNSFPASAQTELREVSLSECPALLDLKRTLRTHFTKVWPTRYVAVCPPAYAAVRRYGDLVPDAHDEASLYRDLRRALVVYLPNDYEASLAFLAKGGAVPRVHNDVGLLSSGAYWSWTLPAPTRSDKRYPMLRYPWADRTKHAVLSALAMHRPWPMFTWFRRWKARGASRLICRAGR